MLESTRNWGDIVNTVQRANLEEATQLRLQEKERLKEYTDLLDQEVYRHRQQSQRKQLEKQQERQVVELQARKEKEERQLQKSQARQKELDYKDRNQEILQQLRTGKVAERKYGQHPFVSLLQGEQKRRLQYRQHLRAQNQLNHLQQQIKRQQRSQQTSIDNQYKNRFVQHVEQFYQKKQQDREEFKKKYLQINSDIDPQILLGQSKLQKGKGEEVDNVLSKINQHVEQPNSSPAFLGRIPINHDRRQQLACIDRNLHKQSGMQIPRRFKTEGNIEVEDPIDRRYTPQIRELPVLQQYYKSHQPPAHQSNPNDFSLPTSPSPATAPLRPPSRNAATLENSAVPAAPRPSRRAFVSYDIIRGQKKLVYI